MMQADGTSAAGRPMLTDNCSRSAVFGMPCYLEGLVELGPDWRINGSQESFDCLFADTVAARAFPLHSGHVWD